MPVPEGAGAAVVVPAVADGLSRWPPASIVSCGPSAVTATVGATGEGVDVDGAVSRGPVGVALTRSGSSVAPAVGGAGVWGGGRVGVGAGGAVVAPAAGVDGGAVGVAGTVVGAGAVRLGVGVAGTVGVTTGEGVADRAGVGVGTVWCSGDCPATAQAWSREASASITNIATRSRMGNCEL